MGGKADNGAERPVAAGVVRHAARRSNLGGHGGSPRLFGQRAQVTQTAAAPRIDAANGIFDRFISTCVFEFLSDDEILAMPDDPAMS